MATSRVHVRAFSAATYKAPDKDYMILICTIIHLPAKKTTRRRHPSSCPFSYIASTASIDHAHSNFIS